MLSGHRSPRSTRHRRVEVPLVGVTDRNGRVVGLVGELTLFRDLDALANHTSQRLQYEDVRAGKPAERRVYRRAPGDDRDDRQVPLLGVGSTADGVRMTSRTWPKQFRAAASTFDWPALAQLAAEYATHLYAVPALPDSVGQVLLVLLVLRQSRRYEELELVADAALAHGPEAPAVRRYYAQALVDGGNPALALRLYTGLAADETAPRVDRIEARGGIGRCYKEMFLACTEPDRGRRFLSRSLEAYLAAYREDTEIYTWPGINAVSLLARAARDGIQLPSDRRRRPHWPATSCGPSTRPPCGTRGPR